MNLFAQTVGAKILLNKKYIAKIKKFLFKERDFLYQKLCDINGLKVYPSATNFILVKIIARISSKQLQIRLLKKHILVRDCSNFYGLNQQYFRISIRNRSDNLRLISELSNIFVDN
ncbi:MAG: hypothetical protein DRP78_05255 [Candidatus Omnitrophota bacterium]|nr:MAG: hypothetical protein DRP78_05255 [Candidatus Omnitrophota bacterium]